MNVFKSLNVVFNFFDNNDISASDAGVSTSSWSWLGPLDCSEVGVGGSDNLCETMNVFLLVVDFDESDTIEFCCRLWFRSSCFCCRLLFAGSCFCVDNVVGNDPIGCRSCGEIPGDCWFNVKFEGFAVGKFAKENRGTFVDDGLTKGAVDDSVEDVLVNWNGWVDPDADDWLTKGAADDSVEDVLLNWNGWFDPDVDDWLTKGAVEDSVEVVLTNWNGWVDPDVDDVCANEKPNGDPPLLV